MILLFALSSPISANNMKTQENKFYYLTVTSDKQTTVEIYLNGFPLHQGIISPTFQNDFRCNLSMVSKINIISLISEC